MYAFTVTFPEYLQLVLPQPCISCSPERSCAEEASEVAVPPATDRGRQRTLSLNLRQKKEETREARTEPARTAASRPPTPGIRGVRRSRSAPEDYGHRAGDVATRMAADFVSRLLLLVWICAGREALAKSLPDPGALGRETRHNAGMGVVVFGVFFYLFLSTIHAGPP